MRKGVHRARRGRRECTRKGDLQLTLVFADASAAPGLHALVVGVGSYSGALGADSTLLRSAPNSALAMANWLRGEYRNLDVPLRSIELLISPADGNTEAEIEFAGKTVERAFMGQAKPQGKIPAYGLAKAVGDWKQRASSSQKNGAFFYFCGHGVEYQGGPHLLLEGFDPSSDAPFESSVDFLRFWRGMDMCLARQQIYIVDACRDQPSWVMSKQNTAPGRGLVELDSDALPIDLATRDAPIFYATASSHRAGSNDGVMSRFTKAFLDVMRGPACRKTGKPRVWRVSTDQIMTSIHELTDAAIWGDWHDQVPKVSGDSGPFDFHTPENPTVPLIVHQPEKSDKLAVKVDGEGCLPLNANTWIRQVPIGDRVVSAESPQGTLASVEVFVQPFFEEVNL